MIEDNDLHQSYKYKLQKEKAKHLNQSGSPNKARGRSAKKDKDDKIVADMQTNLLSAGMVDNSN